MAPVFPRILGDVNGVAARPSSVAVNGVASEATFSNQQELIEVPDNGNGVDIVVR